MNYMLSDFTPPTVTEYLHRQIPITKSMRIEVAHLTAEQVTLDAPLAPNINHSGTAFGGSLSSIAVLAGWVLVQTRLLRAGQHAHVMIHESHMKFARPVAEGFQAVCRLDDGSAWESMLEAVTRNGKGRISLTSTVWSNEEQCGILKGSFVTVMSSLEFGCRE